MPDTSTAAKIWESLAAAALRAKNLSATAKAARMYWWPGSNFGDALSPMIVSYLSGRPSSFSAVFSRRPFGCQIVAIGSLLDEVPQTYGGTVWGTGYISGGPKRPMPRAKVRAVRGHLTAARLRLEKRVPLGDPGVLATKVVEVPQTPTTYRLGLTPHFTDYEAARRTALVRRDDVLLIDVRRPPAVVMRDMAGCRYIASSSLHGMIVADALGIPSTWAPMTTRVTGGSFKFDDYFSAHGRDCVVPLDILGLTSSKEVVAKGDWSLNAVGRMQDALVESFALGRR